MKCICKARRKLVLWFDRTLLNFLLFLQLLNFRFSGFFLFQNSGIFGVQSVKSSGDGVEYTAEWSSGIIRCCSQRTNLA